MQCVIFLPRCQAVITCAGVWIVIFLPMPAVTTCAGYVDCYISTYASCDDLCWVYRVLYFYLCQLHQMHQILFFYLCQLCQAVTTCDVYVDCYISTYASCDDLCWICGLLYFYLCQLWRPVPDVWIVIFLPTPAVTTCTGYTEGYIFTYASYAGCAKLFFSMSTLPGCDDLCRVYRVLYFYLRQLRRMRQVLFFYLCQLCQVVTNCAGYVDCYISTYASYDDLQAVLDASRDDLCRVCRVLYFYLDARLR